MQQVEVKKAQPRGRQKAEREDFNNRSNDDSHYDGNNDGNRSRYYGNNIDPNNNNSGLQGGNPYYGGMTPAMLAQYWQRMQAYYVAMQQLQTGKPGANTGHEPSRSSNNGEGSFENSEKDASEVATSEGVSTPSMPSMPSMPGMPGMPGMNPAMFSGMNPAMFPGGMNSGMNGYGFGSNMNMMGSGGQMGGMPNMGYGGNSYGGMPYNQMGYGLGGNGYDMSQEEPVGENYVGDLNTENEQEGQMDSQIHSRSPDSNRFV